LLTFAKKKGTNTGQLSSEDAGKYWELKENN
jgi:hypothetical protein